MHESAGGIMSKKTVLSLRSFHTITSWTISAIFVLASCMAPSVSLPQSLAQKPNQPPDGFYAKSVTAAEPEPLHFEQVSSTPNNPAFELKMQTGQAIANTIKMPDQGSFKLSVEVGPSNQILDADTTYAWTAFSLLPLQLTTCTFSPDKWLYGPHRLALGLFGRRSGPERFSKRETSRRIGTSTWSKKGEEIVLSYCLKSNPSHA